MLALNLSVELLDHTLIWAAVDLEPKLELFRDYCNHSRTHASLDSNTPAEISGDIVAHPDPLNSYIGKSIAAVFSNCRLLLELEFAMHK